ncbi:MAG: hypothetical protein Q9195_003158 [Heterodermia aff. obscurata]
MITLYWLCAVLAFAFSHTSYAFAVTGLQGGVNASTGERPIRQEISTFQYAGAAFDLYILALQQFVQQDQADPFSFYQIAELAQQIASTYPESSKATYQSAASTLRIPYWDWALDTNMPDVTNQPMININTPNGSQFIANPLYNYTFHPLPSPPDFPNVKQGKYPNTVRYPDDEGRSQPSLANAALNRNAGGIRATLYNLLTSVQTYAAFSNTGSNDGRTNSYNNLENLHNAIHILVGGNLGHMQYISLSSFDPVFFLHHANVDRLFAMWQAVYADTYLTAQVDVAGTYTNAPGASEDVTTALTPFHLDDSGTFHTSNTTRSTRAFGYTYPELLDWNISPNLLAYDVRGHINNLYGPKIVASKRRSEAQLTVAEMSHDYSINVVVNGGMYVRFFLGSIPQQENLWSTASSLVGSHIINGPSRGLVFGQIALTPKLTTYNLPTLGPETVIPLVQETLKYRVQSFGGRSVDVNVVPSLKFAVVSRNVTHLGPNEFPAYGPLVTYTDATKFLGPHGLQEGESMPA